jgi:short-subunit dehydrogenase
MRLDGSTVLLTGATGGIGQAIARALDERGAKLLISGRRGEQLERIAADLGGRPTALAADLTLAADATALAERAGAVDVLVANAALPASGPIVDFTPEEIDRALDVNLRAPVQLTRALLPGMVERGNGHVVLVSSLAGKVASVGSSLYSATKFGLRGFAAGLREDLHGTGVGVTVVFPGFVSGAGMFADSGVRLPRGVGTRRPDQVAAAVVRGIEDDRAEIDVAPLGMRAGALLSGLAPVTAARIQRRLGSAQLSHAIAEGQRPKR